MSHLTLYAGNSVIAMPVRWRNVRHSSTLNGHAALTATAATTRKMAAALFNNSALIHAVLSDNAGCEVWRGYVEDVEISDDGVVIQAFGYGRALYHVTYTGFFAAAGTAGWEAVDEDGIANNELYETDNNNRLYMALRKGEESSLNTPAAIAYTLQHRAEREVKALEFDYEIAGATGNDYRLIVRSFDEVWGYNPADDIVVATTDTTASGSASASPIPAGTRRIAVLFFRNSATPHENTDETGTIYARLVKLRLLSQPATLRQRHIVTDMADYCSAANPELLNAGIIDVDFDGVAIDNAVYEDELPIDIVQHVTAANDCRFVVWNRDLQIVQNDETGAVYQILEGRVNHQRSANNAVTEAYSVYKDENGATLRTTTATTPTSAGIVRRRYAKSDTTAVAVAELERDALLKNAQMYNRRVTIEAAALRDSAGFVVPMERVRAGDVLLFDAVESGGDGLVERFVIGRCEFDHEAGSLSLESAEPVPTIVNLLAGKRGRPGQRNDGEMPGKR